MLSRKVSTSTIPVDTDLSTHLLHMMEEESEILLRGFPREASIGYSGLATSSCSPI